MVTTISTVIANYDKIRNYSQTDGGWHMGVRGQEPDRFYKEITSSSTARAHYFTTPGSIQNANDNLREESEKLNLSFAILAGITTGSTATWFKAGTVVSNSIAASSSKCKLTRQTRYANVPRLRIIII